MHHVFLTLYYLISSHKMKKIFFLAIAALAFNGCVKDSAEYKALQQTNDSLMAVNQSKEKDLDNYLKTLNEIADNFDAIAQSESLINKDAQQEALKDDAAARINGNLKSMLNALENNKKKIEQLKAINKKFGNNNAELQKTLERLEAQLQEKTIAIDSITGILKQKDERIFALDAEVGKLTEDNSMQAAIIAQQSDEMSSAWYVFGTKKELKAQNIITKNGIFSKSQILQADFNRDYFVKIDIRNTKSIPLYSKKATILTSHPKGSYSIKEENGNKIITISDPKEFWSISKYLVVRTD